MNIVVLGATGRTGHLVVEKALAAGHRVTALVRDARKVTVTHPALTVEVGDATDAAKVKAVTEGADVVISAIGPTAGNPEPCAPVTRAVVAAGPRRYVVVSGAGVDVAGDEKDVPGKIVSFMVKTLTPRQYRDKVNELAVLEASQLDWVLVRPPRLLDSPPSGAEHGFKRAPGAMLSRSDLADFLLHVAAEPSFTRTAPFVASRKAGRRAA